MQKIILVKADNPEAAPNRFRSPADALSFLERASLLAENMTAFRADWRLVEEGRASMIVPGDRQILQDLARRLADGSLRIKRAPVKPAAPVRVAGVSSAASNASRARAQPASTPLKIRPRPGAEAGPTQAEMDAAQQAKALEDAAESGAPFCEKCEKARQEQEGRAPADA